MNTITDNRAHTVQPTWRARIGMPENGFGMVAPRRGLVPGAVSLKDTCALVTGPRDGSGYRAAVTDASPGAFAGTPAWSPPI